MAAKMVSQVFGDKINWYVWALLSNGFLKFKNSKVFYKVNKLKDKTKQLEHLSWV